MEEAGRPRLHRRALRTDGQSYSVAGYCTSMATRSFGHALTRIVVQEPRNDLLITALGLINRVARTSGLATLIRSPNSSERRFLSALTERWNIMMRLVRLLFILIMDKALTCFNSSGHAAIFLIDAGFSLHPSYAVFSPWIPPS